MFETQLEQGRGLQTWLDKRTECVLIKKKKLFYIFGCAGSSQLLLELSLVAESGGYLRCGVQASHCSGFSCRAQAVGRMCFSSSGSRALVHRIISCGTLA